MLSNRIQAFRLLYRAARPSLVSAGRPSVSQRRWESQDMRANINDEVLYDPDMNGGYINPPRVSRQHRDPYGDWWDKQERRNFGEPVHEDNDILGVFSPEEQTHVTPGKAALLVGCLASVILGFIGAVSFVYPDRQSTPRTFPGGLERELGGPSALRARSEDDEY